MFAPQAIATYVRFFVRCRSTHALTPAIASAPAAPDRARVLEDVLERRAGRVGIDANDLVDVLAHEAERFLADLLHRHAVGEEPTCASFTRRPRRSSAPSRRSLPAGRR
jgi:hypothetical protein